MTEEELNEAIKNCDTEPIHAPNTIQSFGAIIGVDKEFNTLFYSKNLHLFFENIKKEPDIFELFKESKNDILKAIKCLDKKESETIWIKNLSLNIIKNRDFFIFELEKSHDNSENNQDDLQFLSSISKSLKEANSLDEIFVLIIKSIKEYLSYDRVMLYKFDQNYDGEVIAEAKNDYMNSFLNHSFPATDIPQNARRLYEKMPIRLIENVNSTPIELEFLDISFKENPIDMSLLHSRAVAPIHIEYLKNMSVEASFSISIVIDNKLWGLIACHHNKPKYVPLKKRLLVKELSLILSAIIKEREVAQKNYQNSIRILTLFEIVKNMKDDFEKLFLSTQQKVFEHLLILIPANGIAIKINQNIINYGLTPHKNDISEILEKLKTHIKDQIYAINSIASIDPYFEKYHKNACGILILSLNNNNQIVWFRSEVTKHIAWAGQPIKRFYTESGKLYISPRKSFETYWEEKKFFSEPWSSDDISYAKELKEILDLSKSTIYNKNEPFSKVFFSSLFMQIYDFMPQALAITNIDAQILYVNSAFLKISGYESEELLGKNINILKSGMHDKNLYAELWSTILSLKVWHGQIINKRKDGTLFYVDATIAPIVDENGEIIYYVGIEHEITKLKNEIESINKEKQEIKRELELIEKENEMSKIAELAKMRFEIKKEMLTLIAHHWRNPLNVISLMFMDLFSAFENKKINEEYLLRFEKELNSILQELSNTIKDFATHFRPPDNKTRFQLCKTINEIIDVLRPSFEAEGVVIELACQEIIELYGYKSAISTIIVEILTNAKEIKIARNLDSIDVYIAVYLIEHVCIIEISDNGGGIENIEKIFEPYYTTKGVGSGLGLGLYQVRVLLENYFNGTIEASNTVLGAKFKIKIKFEENE